MKTRAKDYLRSLQRKQAQLRVRGAEVALAWAKGSPTARVDRAQLDLEMRANALEIREAEFLLEREGDERRREYQLSIAGRTWSDQMVAALTYLLTQLGQREVVSQAEKMVRDGWPNAQPKITKPIQIPAP